MAQLLHIDSSPRQGRSHTRALTREFVERWLAQHPADDVVYRDIGRNPPPNVDADWIAAAFAPPGRRTPEMNAALETSDALVDELLAADVLVIGMPMYNFSVPAAFKAWIDQVVRIRRTFEFDPADEAAPYKPLLHGKRGFVIVATGDSGYERGGSLANLNHLDPYVRTVFGFIGISDLTFIHAGNDEFGGEKLARSLSRASSRIAEVVNGPAGSPRTAAGGIFGRGANRRNA